MSILEADAHGKPVEQNMHMFSKDAVTIGADLYAVLQLLHVGSLLPALRLQSRILLDNALSLLLQHCNLAIGGTLCLLMAPDSVLVLAQR